MDYTNLFLVFIAASQIVIIYLLSTWRMGKPKGDNEEDRKFRKELYNKLLKIKKDLESTV